MLSAVREIADFHRCASCHRIPLTDKTAISGVPVNYSSTTGKARYSNLNACGSVWVCPVCSLRIASKRQVEVKHILDEHIAQNGRLFHMVQTFKHTRDDDLSHLLDRLASAREMMHRAREFKELMFDFGYVGFIRALEVTHSFNNGWHPHTHELILTNDEWYISSFPRFKSRYLAMWKKYAKRAGLYSIEEACTFDIASDDSQSTDNLARYLTLDSAIHESIGMTNDDLAEANEQDLKHVDRYDGVVSSASKEIAFQVMKNGKGESRSPFQLLRDFALDGDALAGALFHEYALAFDGKKPLVFSRGLKKKFGVKDKKDLELAYEADTGEKILGLINKEEWKAILKGGIKVRGTILMLAENGEWDIVANYIEDIYIKYLDDRIRRGLNV